MPKRKPVRKRAPIGKKPNGRPPKYDDDMPQALVDYYFACAGSRSTDPSVPVLKETFNRLPTFTGFAMHVGVTPRTLYNWSEKYPLFREAMDQCNAIQDDMLQQFSLNGVWNPSMATFVLQAKHNWVKTDRVDTNTNIHLSFDSQDEDA
jgi:hypothetical protein